jgi:hypothetical protein
MQARRGLETRVLRTLVAALDNAEAVPMADAHEKYVVRRFGDRSAEAPRLTLAAAEVQALLEREAAQRLEAALELERLGQGERAAGLREEAAVVARYVGSSEPED